MLFNHLKLIANHQTWIITCFWFNQYFTFNSLSFFKILQLKLGFFFFFIRAFFFYTCFSGTSARMESTTASVLFHDYKQDNEGSMAEGRLVELVVLCIVIVLSLTGNTLVVVISVFWTRLRSPSSIFILNLALSDLLFTVGLVFRVWERIWGLTLRDAACKAVHCVLPAGFYSSIVFLMLMTVQRYMAVVHSQSGWEKGRCFALVLTCAWIVSVLASLPVALHIVADPDSGFCTYSSETAYVAITYKENVVFVCAFLFTAFCYTRILRSIRKSPEGRTHRITALAFVLVAAFFICWAPFNIMIFLNTLAYDQIKRFTQDLEDFYHASYICHVLGFTRCCFNPVIYGLFGVTFRATVREILQRRSHFTAAQTRMAEQHLRSCVGLNNPVPELDVWCDDFSDWEMK